jgi:SAM-dependent methyltransferase
MSKREDERHRYGRHYTPLDVASLLAAFAVRGRQDVILDPSCGDGRLLRETLKIKNSSKRRDCELEVFGIDRSAVVESGARAGFQFGRADFFDLEPGARLTEALSLPLSFDAIIGNPPYIRQEVMGSDDKQRIERRLTRDRARSPEIFYPAWSRRSDIYVYFFAHSARFLKVGGRLVFLTAASWLDVGYGVALREFLLANFRIIAIIESACESFFSDASINTVITVLELEPDVEARLQNPVRFVRLSAPLSKTLQRPGSGGDPAVAFASSVVECTRSPVVTATHRIRVVSQSELKRRTNAEQSAKRVDVIENSPGWGRYLRAEDVFFQVLARGSGTLKQLSDLARVRFGVKTGVNEFFYVDGAPTPRRRKRGAGSGSPGKRPKGAGLRRLDEVASVRRGLTTGANAFFYLRNGNRTTRPGARAARRAAADHLVVEDGAGATHPIESRYLSPVVFSLKELPGILLDQKQTRRLLFNCMEGKSALKGTRALEYIRSGERAGHHLRPTCAARRQWYSVTGGMEPAPLILPSKVGERWVIAINRAGVFEDKKLYGVFPQARVSALVLAALLNSTWARYYAELTCRQMTGAQAIADIDVAVAEGIVLPDPRELPAALKEGLKSSLALLTKRPVRSVFEEVKRADRRRLDRLVLEAIGFNRQVEREAVLDELYQAVVNLVRERLSKK